MQASASTCRELRLYTFEYCFFFFFFLTLPSSPYTPASCLFTSKRVLRGSEFRFRMHINMYINGVQYSDHTPWHMEFQYTVEWLYNKDVVIAFLQIFPPPSPFDQRTFPDPALTLQLANGRFGGWQWATLHLVASRWFDPPVSTPPIPGVSVIGPILIIEYRHFISSTSALRMRVRNICESLACCVKRKITH